MSSPLRDNPTKLARTVLNQHYTHWLSEQQVQAETVQRKLFHGKLSDYSAPDITPFQLFELVDDTETCEAGSVIQLEACVIDRMLSGSSAIRPLTAEQIAAQMMALVNIKTTNPDLYEEKKKRSSTISKFVSYVQTAEDFQFPSPENGTPLRDLLTLLITNVKREYPLKPRDAALFMIQTLMESKHKPLIEIALVTNINTSDEQLDRFESDCADGNLNSDSLTYGNIATLPGFTRFTGELSEVYWVRTASALLDLAAHEIILDVDAIYVTSHQDWLQFRFCGSSLKVEKAEEARLFLALQTAAAKAERSAPDNVDRAEQILTVIPTKYQTIIRKKAAKARLGAAGRTRKWILDLFANIIEDDNHVTATISPDQTPSTNLTTTATHDITSTCKDCSCKITFSIKDQLEFKKKGYDDPIRCEPCRQLLKAARKKLPCNKFAQGRCSSQKCNYSHENTPATFVADTSDRYLNMDDEVKKCNCIGCNGCKVGGCTNQFELPATKKAWLKQKGMFFTSRCDDCKAFPNPKYSDKDPKAFAAQAHNFMTSMGLTDPDLYQAEEQEEQYAT